MGQVRLHRPRERVGLTHLKSPSYLRDGSARPGEGLVSREETDRRAPTRRSAPKGTGICKEKLQVLTPALSRQHARARTGAAGLRGAVGSALPPPHPTVSPAARTSLSGGARLKDVKTAQRRDAGALLL